MHTQGRPYTTRLHLVSAPPSRIEFGLSLGFSLPLGVLHYEALRELLWHYPWEGRAVGAYSTPFQVHLPSIGTVFHSSAPDTDAVFRVSGGGYGLLGIQEFEIVATLLLETYLATSELIATK